MINIDRRLIKLETANQLFADVEKMIDSGRRYLDINEKERERYALYWGTDCAALEDVERAVRGSLDFPLERRGRKTPQKELQAIIDEIKKIVLTTDENRKEV